MKSIFYLMALSGFLILTLYGCGDSSSPLERTYGVGGKTYCEETAAVFKSALDLHITRSQSDADALYSKTLSDMLSEINSIATQNRAMSSEKYNEDYNQLKTELANAPATQLSDCADLVKIQDFANRNSVSYRGQVQGSKTDDPINPVQPAVFHAFLSNFAQNLDPFSHYFYGQGGANRLTYNFGVSVDANSHNIYGDSQTEVEVFATDDEADNPLKIHDRILSVSDPLTEPTDTPSILTSVGTLLNDTAQELVANFGVINFEQIFSNSPTPYLSVKVKRAGTEKEEIVSLSRRASEKPPLVSTEVIDDHIIWARLKQFDVGLAPELTTKLNATLASIKSKASSEKSANENSKTGIILDLRFNPGGSVMEIHSLVNLFLDKGTVGTMKSKTGGQMKEEPFTLLEHAKFKDQPLIILINHRSASASDISTQFLQETGRAFVVGETSFGKGIGQASISLNGISHLGGVLYVTTIQFYGPSGKSIQAVGNEPNHPVVDPKIERMRNACLAKNQCRFLRMADYAKNGRDIPPTGSPVAPITPLTNVTKTEVTAAQINGAQNAINALPKVPDDIVLENAKQIMKQLIHS